MAGSPPFRGFLIDADNTIFDYDRAEREALGRGPSPKRDWSRHPRSTKPTGASTTVTGGPSSGATVTQEELKVERFRQLLAEEAPGCRADPAAVSRRYLSMLAMQVHLLPHAASAIADLAGRAALGLATNGIPEVQRGRLERSGLASCFRTVLISGEIGIAKPDPRFFLLGAERLGLSPSEVLCVGDVPATDIRGARAAGMASCWVAAPGAVWPPGEPGPDYTIRDLRALAALAPRFLRKLQSTMTSRCSLNHRIVVDSPENREHRSIPASCCLERSMP